VDLAAQTAAPLARWIHESALFEVMAALGVRVNFWHIADAGKDAVDLLERLLETNGEAVHYVVVKNLGWGSDSSPLEQSSALKKALTLGAQVISLGNLQESSMRKIDRNDASFWAAVNQTSGPIAWVCWSASAPKTGSRPAMKPCVPCRYKGTAQASWRGAHLSHARHMLCTNIFFEPQINRTPP